MLLVVLLGVVLILVARTERATNAPAGPPRIGDHWHSLYTIYDCDDFVPDFYPNDADDFSGIHTHGDGLIHIHPFHAGVTGQFATVGAFMSEIEVEFDDSTHELPDGSIINESDDLCASPDPDSDDPAVAEPGAELRILRWETIQAEKAVAFDENLRDVRFLSDGQLFVFARVHPSIDDADVPRPDDAFLRSYLQLPAEGQPIADTSSEEGPVLPGSDDGSSGGDPGDDSGDDLGDDSPGDDLPVTDEPASDDGAQDSSMPGALASSTS